MQIVSTSTQLERDRKGMTTSCAMIVLAIKQTNAFAFDLKSATCHCSVNVCLRYLHSNHFSLQTGGKLTTERNSTTARTILSMCVWVFFLAAASAAAILYYSHVCVLKTAHLLNFHFFIQTHSLQWGILDSAGDVAWWTVEHTSWHMSL